MRSKQIALVAAVTLVASWAVGGVAYAQKPTTAGNQKATSSPWTTTGSNTVKQCLGADTCVATGSQSLATSGAVGAVSSQTSLVRTTPYAGSDQASELSDVALNFTLSLPAKSVSADIDFTQVALGNGFGAQTSDGQMFAQAGIGAEIVDSGCSDRSCGSTGARVDSYVAYSHQLGPVDATLLNHKTLNTSSAQTIHVNLSMPDGSDIPPGVITIFADTFAGVWLYPIGCTETPQTQKLCTAGIPHTGSAQAAISATVSSIKYTVGSA